VAGRDDTYTIAFESGSLSYSDLPMDLYNTGVNQILSVAAARGHRIRHFRMADLYEHEGVPHARMSFLELAEGWSGEEVWAHRGLREVAEQSAPLEEIDVCFFRADDVRDEHTPNIEVIRRLESTGLLIETVENTLATCDKYEIYRRAPNLPAPVTLPAETPEEAMEAIAALPKVEGYFVLKDRFGYGCGEQVHRLLFDAEDLRESVGDYVRAYGRVIVQEFCPEVEHGDIAVTFLGDDLVAPLRRTAQGAEWKTNASLGALEQAYELTPEQERVAREAREAFPSARLISVDILESGRVLEVNAFPGGAGLFKAYGIALGRLVMDRVETEWAAGVKKA